MDRDEIAASVAAHSALGPGYDEAVAEGLVERIGAEIDKRITAEVDSRVDAEISGKIATELDRYAGCRHLRRRARRIQAARSGRPPVALALGSMLFATTASLIVLLGGASRIYTANGGAGRSGPGAGTVLLTALIWIVIGVINVAYARRQQ